MSLFKCVHNIPQRALVVLFLAWILMGCQTSFRIQKTDVQTTTNGSLLISFKSDHDLAAMAQGRSVQFRCYMELNNVTNKEIIQFGEILQGGQDITTLRQSKLEAIETEWHSYSARLFSGDFMDLQNNYYRLNEPRVIKLRCHVVGVTKGPGVFYKSNFIDIYTQKFLAGMGSGKGVQGD